MSALHFGVRRRGQLYVARAEFNRDLLGEGVDRRHHEANRKSSVTIERMLSPMKLYGMAARMFDKGRDGFNTKALSWTGDTQKAILVDCTASTGNSLKLVTNATNASPVVYTVTANGFSNNDLVVVGGILGNLSANQTGLVTSQATNTIDMTTLEGQTIAGSGAYVSGGYAINLTLAQFVVDILGTRVGTDPTISGTSSSKGVANATSPITWTTVPAGNPAQVVIFYDAAGGSDAANKLLALQDGKIRVITVGDSPSTSTSIKVQPLRAQIWDGVTGTAPVLWFSNGFSATLSASAAQGADSISVTSTGHDIPDLQTADVNDFGGGLPVTPSGGNISFNIGSIYAPLTPTGIYQL
jgi:hypothetical protein